ncbi:thiE [Symbiodinium sp. CCMP2592]|nr:thiE [Symbiodinium sp. CCMP2592]
MVCCVLGCACAGVSHFCSHRRDFYQRFCPLFDVTNPVAVQTPPPKDTSKADLETPEKSAAPRGVSSSPSPQKRATLAMSAPGAVQVVKVTPGYEPIVLKKKLEEHDVPLQSSELLLPLLQQWGSARLQQVLDLWNFLGEGSAGSKSCNLNPLSDSALSVWGPRGTGKSALVEDYLQRMRFPYVKLSGLGVANRAEAHQQLVGRLTCAAIKQQRSAKSELESLDPASVPKHLRQLDQLQAALDVPLATLDRLCCPKVIIVLDHVEELCHRIGKEGLELLMWSFTAQWTETRPMLPGFALRSREKRAWCCEHEGIACEEEFHCDVAIGNYQLAWSLAKKRYCCKHAGFGCEGLPDELLPLTTRAPQVDPGNLLAKAPVAMWPKEEGADAVEPDEDVLMPCDDISRRGLFVGTVRRSEGQACWEICMEENWRMWLAPWLALLLLLVLWILAFWQACCAACCCCCRLKREPATGESWARRLVLASRFWYQAPLVAAGFLWLVLAGPGLLILEMDRSAVCYKALLSGLLALPPLPQELPWWLTWLWLLEEYKGSILAFLLASLRWITAEVVGRCQRFDVPEGYDSYRPLASRHGEDIDSVRWREAQEDDDAPWTVLSPEHEYTRLAEAHVCAKVRLFPGQFGLDLGK